jgi:hypothetical protein
VYQVHDVATGSSIDLILGLPAGSAPNAVFKVQDGVYSDVSSLASIAGDTITLHLTDGGAGDEDGVANGVIVDPVIPVRMAAAPVNGLISGTVTDEVTGQPVRGAVAVIDSSGRFVRGVVTDAAGRYSVPVAAGDYRVEFIDGSGRHTGVWYDGHGLNDYAAATLVHVGVAETVTADAALAPAGPTGTIAGVVTDTDSSGPISNAWVIAVRSSDGVIVGGALTDGSGHYAISGLNAGNHRLVVIDPTMAHRPELFYQDRSDFGSADDIAVTAGHSTTVNAGLDPVTA